MAKTTTVKVISPKSLAPYRYTAKCREALCSFKLTSNSPEVLNSTAEGHVRVSGHTVEIEDHDGR